MPDGRPVCSVCGQCNYLQASNRLKPTLGVIPKKLWIEQRIFLLKKAIEALSAQVAANPNSSDPSPLVEWVQEITELVAEAKKAGKQ